MGNWKSRPVKSQEQRRARLQREHGILMPPSFVNGTLLPIANQAALQANQAITPSILDYLWETNPGTRLLQEYLQPGIAMRIPTSPSSYNDGASSGEIFVGLQPIPQQDKVGDGHCSSIPCISPRGSMISLDLDWNSKRQPRRRHRLQLLPVVLLTMRRRRTKLPPITST